MPKKKTNWHAQKVQASAKRRNYAGIPGSNSGIQSDDFGVFVTCDKGREGRCCGECIDLLEKAAIELGYIDPSSLDIKTINDKVAADDHDDAEDDIEASIAAELESMRPGKKEPEKGNGKVPFRAVKLDIPCVSFIKFLPSIFDSSAPSRLVHHICSNASSTSEQNPSSSRPGSKPEAHQQSRYIKRLTPITRIRKTLNPGSLESLCSEVLSSTFRQGPPKKFAIRPTTRNNDLLNRDIVIKTVASWISGDDQTEKRHSVDLKHWDVLVLVEVYRNVIGMSIVEPDYEKLKRYNLAEIYHPSSSSSTTGAVTAGTGSTATFTRSEDIPTANEEEANDE